MLSEWPGMGGLRATGGSTESMMRSEVNVKAIGPNSSLTQRNINTNPSTNKKALL